MTVFYRLREERSATGDQRPMTGDGPRVGFTVGRVIGGAVERNRIRRRMREAVRTNLPALAANVDVVFNPKKSARTADFEELKAEVARALAVIHAKCGAGPGLQTGEKRG